MATNNKQPKMTQQKFRDLVKRGLEKLPIEFEDLCEDGQLIIGELRQELGMEPVYNIEDCKLMIENTYDLQIDSDYLDHIGTAYNDDDLIEEIRRLGHKVAILDQNNCIIASTTYFDIDLD